MADTSALERALVNADAAGDVEAARVLAGEITRLRSTSAPDAPKPLPMPWQSVLNIEARLRIDRARALDFMTCPVGQIVGDMRHESSVRQIIYDMLDEFGETMAGMGERAGIE